MTWPRPVPGISIHALREGSDGWFLYCKVYYQDFNPRSPRGERLSQAEAQQRFQYFNPRSPRGERQLNPLQYIGSVHFNPRSPRGERHSVGIVTAQIGIFQSTLSARGATQNNTIQDARNCISIHALREGSDFSLCFSLRIRSISIHALREGSDFVLRCLTLMTQYFNPRSPRGERQQKQPK